MVTLAYVVPGRSFTIPSRFRIGLCITSEIIGHEQELMMIGSIAEVLHGCYQPTSEGLSNLGLLAVRLRSLASATLIVIAVVSMYT